MCVVVAYQGLKLGASSVQKANSFFAWASSMSHLG